MIPSAVFHEFKAYITTEYFDKIFPALHLELTEEEWQQLWLFIQNSVHEATPQATGDTAYAFTIQFEVNRTLYRLALYQTLLLAQDDSEAAYAIFTVEQDATTRLFFSRIFKVGFLVLPIR